MIVITNMLKSGHKKSCGCLQREVISAKNKSRRKYPKETQDRIYSIWKGMWNRTTNPNQISYEKYGAVGISLCPEWQDYLVFREWSLLNGYEDNLSIDRIDNSKGYEPSNCRWATRIEQQVNKTNNNLITFNNKTQTASQWAEELNITRNTIYKRLYRGASSEEALHERNVKE